MSEKEDLLIRVIGTSNELDNLRLDDKLLYILNRKLTTDPKSDILKSVIKSKNDLSDLNIIPHLKNQLNVPLEGWSKKEELLYHAVHANKTLDQLESDLQKILLHVLDRKFKREKRYVYTDKEKLLFKILDANESLAGVSFDANMIEQLLKVSNKTDRQELMFRCLNCKDDISNLLLLDKMEKQLEARFNKSYNMTLKSELIYKTLKASDDLRGLDLFFYYNTTLKLKYEDKIELVAKEEVMVRILNANANYDGIQLDDVLVQSLKNKDKRTPREELIYRALRADNNL